MNVLSLFDGISAGQVALERAGIVVDKYYAAEVDKHAIAVTKANYPGTVQLGDVTKWREWDIAWSSIDLLIGGSPCQGFSFAGKQLAFNDPRSALFFVYVDILNHIRSTNPRVKFLLENVKMKKEFLDTITEYLGVEPVFINSALVSAQNRQRYYWANWEFGQPEDKCLTIIDIEDGSFITPSGKGSVNNKRKSKNIPINSNGVNQINAALCTSVQPRMQDRVFHTSGKSHSLSAAFCSRTNVGDFNVDSWRKLTPLECERLQTFPDGYTAHVGNTQRYKALGNSWTVDVVAHIFKNMA